MAKTGAKGAKKTYPLEFVNAGRQGTSWWNRYSSKNAQRAARKEPRMAAGPQKPRKVGAGA